MRANLSSCLMMAALGGAVTLGASCNTYDMFRVSGFAQEEFTNDAEVLFVIDNSDSMQPYTEQLALNFDVFINNLTDPDGSGSGADGLTDIVDEYIRLSGRGGLDYQLAITTTDVQNLSGQLMALNPDDALVRRGERDVAGRFRRNLLCAATCWEELNLQPPPEGWEPGDGFGVDDSGDEFIHAAYLDDICGVDVWRGNCGTGQEEGLEAIGMALCRAVDDPPDECFDARGRPTALSEDDVGTNDGLLRDNSNVVAVIVTDEGDQGTRRMDTNDGDPDEYIQFYSRFGRRMNVAVIGPTYRSDPDVCKTQGSFNDTQLDRYVNLVDYYGGFFYDIVEGTPESEDDPCRVADFSEALVQLSDLINNLLRIFPLQGVPDVETLRVYVDDRLVDEAPEIVDETTGETSFGSGWVYNAAENGVEFFGDAIPDYGAKVRIYYRPLAGMPRDLPFGSN